MKNPAAVHAFARIHGFRIKPSSRASVGVKWTLVFPGSGSTLPCCELEDCVEVIRSWLRDRGEEKL